CSCYIGDSVLFVEICKCSAAFFKFLLFGDNLLYLYVIDMRTFPLKLKQLQILTRRTLLDETEEKEKEKLTRGWQGELGFDKLIDTAVRGKEIYHLRDYRFKIDSGTETLKVASGMSEVQIDNVLIAGDHVYTFEVKNFGFDLIYDSKIWFFESGGEYKDWRLWGKRQRTSVERIIIIG